MFLLEFGLSLLQMEQKFIFVGTIDKGDSYLEFPFRHTKVFKLHQKQHDDAGALRAHSDKVQATVSYLDEDQFTVYLVTWLDYSFAFA